MKIKLPKPELNKVSIIFLLPLFFVWHGFVENYALVNYLDASLLLLQYVLIGMTLCLLFFFAFQSWTKVFLFVSFLMAIQFFFGVLHDGLKSLLNDSIITSYKVVIPSIFISVILLFIVLKKENTRSFNKLFIFLNLVLFILISIDVASFIGKNIREDGYGNGPLASNLLKCDTCSTPDIYWIIADEYAGKKELNEFLNFDNSLFENRLQELGFHLVKNSKSNYNITPFSIASTLNLNYLPLKRATNLSTEIPMVMGMIRNNAITNFLALQGYTIYNNSIFDLQEESKNAESPYLPNKTDYISAQTFFSRIKRDLSFHLITTLKISWFHKKGYYKSLFNNTSLYERTIETSHLRNAPKFSYTHLSMPHDPYYYNEKGQPNSFETLLDYTNDKNYVGYLQYTNNKLISLVEQILKNSVTPPVIFLMSDHGYRQNNTKYQFTNLCAVYLPQKKYDNYYDGLSSVNIFRIFFNNQFQQSLQLLPDSTIFLKE
jgi:hypothetical protein